MVPHALIADAESPLDNIVTLYASLRQGLSPVVKAEVYAVIKVGDTKQTVELNDNGTGKTEKVFHI